MLQSIEAGLAVIKLADNVTAAFKLVSRGRPVCQAIPDDRHPAVFVDWALEREDDKRKTGEVSKRNIVFLFTVHGSKTVQAHTNIDDTLAEQRTMQAELIDLKERLIGYFNGLDSTWYTGGGSQLAAPLEYKGSDGSTFYSNPASEIKIAMSTTYVTAKTNGFS